MKTALLIIDIQNDYFPGGKMELVGSIEAAAAAARLLASFRDRTGQTSMFNISLPSQTRPFFCREHQGPISMQATL